MNKELKVLKMMKKDGLTWVEASKKQKEIKTLESAKLLVTINKQNIEALNKHFSEANIKLIQEYITDCVSKEATAKAEGIERFKTDKIDNVGSPEWKNFITAAEKFAKNQKKETVYPVKDDSCLLCQQPLSSDAQQLITNYWTYIKSIAEQDAKNALTLLDKSKNVFEKLNFDLFPEDTTLITWLTEKHSKILSSLQADLIKQKALATNIISDISTKVINDRTGIKIETLNHDTIIEAIDASIKLLKDDQQNVELDKLLKENMAFEAILVNADNTISEGSKSNVFFVKSNKFYTAPSAMVLEGITRKKVMECLHELNFPVIEEAVSISDLQTFDGVFLTGTSPKVLPVYCIDTIQFPSKNFFVQQLMDRYDLMIETYLKVHKPILGQSGFSG